MRRSILLILVLSLVLVGCQSPQPSEDQSPTGEVKEPVVKDQVEEEKSEKAEIFKSFYTLPIEDFTPNKLTNYETASILRNINEGLYKIDQDGNLYMGLAESIEVTEVEGYLMYDIVLKDNIKFHDGTPIKPEDVQYSFFRYAGLIPEVDNKNLENFKYWVNLLDGAPGSGFKKGRVETLGSDRIILFVDNFYGEKTTSSLIASTYIVPKAYGEADQAKNPIGAGPYKLDSIGEDGSLRLSYFDGYYGLAPDIREISLIKSASKEERNEMFAKGDLDMVDSYPAVDKNDDFRPFSGDLYSLVYNVDDELMKDKDLRMAINSLINKEDIKAQLFGQAGGVAESPLSPYFYKDLPDFVAEKSFNPEATKAILEARPELLENPLTISYLGEDFLSQALAETLQAYIGFYGFTVNLEPLAYSDFIQRTTAQPDKAYQMAIFRYSGDIDSHKIFDRFTTRAARNISNFYSMDYNEVTKTDKDNFQKMFDMIKEVCPETFIMDPGKSYKMKDDFTEPLVYPYPNLDFSSIKNK